MDTFFCIYFAVDLLHRTVNHSPVIFQDSHFSDFVDKQTKYTTKCMITAPIMSEKEPIGVVMALNKQGADAFSKSDQEVSGQAVHF